MESGPRPFFNDIQVADKGKVVDNASATLSVFEQFITAKSDTAVLTLTLPGVAEAKGKTYSIYSPNGLTNNVTITHAGDSIGWADIVKNTNGSFTLLYSDGRAWYTLSTK